MNVRATVERLGREHVGKSWWVDLAEALVAEFEPVVAERDRLRDALEFYATANDATWLMENGERARAALDRGTP